MAAVLHLVKRSNEDAIELLEWMLAEAKQERLFDICLWFLDERGAESAAFTGIYKADKAKALMAAMRLSKHLTLAHDSTRSGP